MIKPKHVGKRLLIRQGWSSKPDEVKVIEMSPDERYFKFKHMNGNGNPTWDKTTGWIVESELPDTEEVV